MRSTGVVFNTNHELHDYMLKGFPSPESPARLQKIMQHFRDNDVFEKNNYTFLIPNNASSMVILECGFDSYYKEKLAKLKLIVDSYYGVVSLICSKWPTIVLLEGGYHDDLGLLADVVVQALADNRYAKDEVDQMNLLAFRQSSCRCMFGEKLHELKNLSHITGNFNM